VGLVRVKGRFDNTEGARTNEKVTGEQGIGIP